MFKYLTPIKSYGVDDDTSATLLEHSYNYYKTNIIDNQFIEKQDEKVQSIISCFYRFLKVINSSKIIEEDLLQKYIKDEVFKNKPKTITLLNQYINEIKGIQLTRVLFSTPDLQKLRYLPNKYENQGKKIKRLINFDYKINVDISNTYSNKILLPEVFFIFTFDDGSVLQTKASLRIINEFRKDLTINLKRIRINDNIPLLK